MRISSRTVGRALRTSSVCQSAVISASEIALERFELRLGDRDAVELLQQIGDAAALEHDGAAGDLGGMRGEDRGDADACQVARELRSAVEAGLAQAAERARADRRAG